jgi:hypothetical protein
VALIEVPYLFLPEKDGMYTSALFVALLSGLLPPATLDAPAWQTQYEAARKLGRQGGKPLAVFIASGQTGWNQLLSDGQLGKETRRMLATEYVCLYVDVTATGGKQLAAALAVTSGLGLVISDASGDIQAFRHEGKLAEDVLARHLKKYADRDRLVEATELSYVKRAEPLEDIQPATLDASALLSTGRSC